MLSRDTAVLAHPLSLGEDRSAIQGLSRVLLDTDWGRMAITFRGERLIASEFVDTFSHKELHSRWADGGCTLKQELVIPNGLKSGVRAVILGYGDKAAEERALECWSAFWSGQIVNVLPQLEISGTTFQLLVWAAVLKIPLGQTLSYQALAESLGSARLTRAVAGAVAKNKIALFIPCHRVIAKNGGMQGYRWGTERKGALLQRESDRADYNAMQSSEQGNFFPLTARN